MFFGNWFLLLLIPSFCHCFTITTIPKCCSRCSPNRLNNRCYPIHWIRKTTAIQDNLLSDENIDIDTKETSACASGLYRPFVDYAWQLLMNSQSQNLSPVQVPIESRYKETVAPGPKNNSTVRITIEVAASQNNTNDIGPIQYARYALIETIQMPSTQPMDVDDVQNDTPFHPQSSSDGIQVLNMVIIPYKHTGLPVFGADFVALPGNKHLLLLDAQPVRGYDRNSSISIMYDDWFRKWYERNDIPEQFDWGGDLPEPVQQYVSKYALWTRFTGSGDSSSNLTDPIEIIRGPVMAVFQDHLQTYLQLLNHYEETSTKDGLNNRHDSTNSSRLTEYLTYRLDNDPARPMLKRLFGADWTEQVLHDILFPIHLF